MSVRPVASRRVRRVARTLLSCCLLAVALGAAGCGVFDPGSKVKPDPIGPLPAADTPQAAMERLRLTYEREDLVDYAPLLTTDFRYTFSSQTDPQLVTRYGNNWGKLDEMESAQHLFQGFVNSTGETLPGASQIMLQFDNPQFFPDPAHTDSAEYYQYVPVTNVVLVIVVSSATTQTEYDIVARHDFYLVRGDAAVLEAGQPADAKHWYVRHWDDLSAPTAPGGAAAPALAAASWGSMRGSYGE